MLDFEEDDDVTPRPMLIGEDNPYGSDPQFALYCEPPHSAGGRLCRYVLGLRRSTYLDAFERANLCSTTWRAKEARDRAFEIMNQHEPGRWYILCGAKVARAFDLRPATAEEPIIIATRYPEPALGGYAVIPHPSGRCRLWNDLTAAQVRRSLAEILPDIPFGERASR